MLRPRTCVFSCLLAVVVVVCACSSDESSNGGGSGSGTCASYCDHLLAAKCKTPAADRCASNCASGTASCPDEGNKVTACATTAPVLCDSTGEAVINGCLAEQSALQKCVASKPKDAGSGG